MKKVMIDIRELEKGKYTGISRVILLLLKKAQAFSNYEFLLVGNTRTDFERISGFKRFLISDRINFLSEQIEIYNLIKKTKPDIFFSPYYKYPLLADTKIITSIFDLTYLILEKYRRKIKNKFYIKNFIKLFYKNVDIIITSSINTKKDIISFFNIPENRIKVVYLPVDEKFRPGDYNEILSVKDKFKIEKNYILYAGNNNYHKNLKTLYKAYIDLPYEIRSVYQLVFAGFNDFKNEYPLAKVIGPVCDRDLICLYSGCSLFVFPSLYEGFGYPPLEAYFCGAKVICSNIPSLYEIFGESCNYFNPYNVEELKEKIKQEIFTDGEKKQIDRSRFLPDNFVSNIKAIFDNL